jgi:hypothetical protein
VAVVVDKPEVQIHRLIPDLTELLVVAVVKDQRN